MRLLIYLCITALAMYTMVNQDSTIISSFRANVLNTCRFNQPKAFLIFQLLTGEPYTSPLKASLAMLYQTCAADLLNEYTYDARLAGLTYDFQVLPRGVRLTFGGYNDKLKSFASYLSVKLARDLDDVLPGNEEEFERYEDNLLRALSAFKVKQPYDGTSSSILGINDIDKFRADRKALIK